ncbi:phage major capsid protein [Mycobacteroides abscessus subsp. bolletii]|nr:phage major capsid protein [Mycobacteroides abscessus subsp. bolletii]
MSQSTTNAAPILRPEQVEDLVIQPVTQTSVALQVSSVVRTTSKSTRFPVLTDDPTGAWTPEGAEIAVSDAEFEEIDCEPKKVAGLTVISSELAADADPDASKTIGDALVRSLVAKIDAAFFAASTSNGPSGLGSAGAQTIAVGATLTNIDPFLEAISKSEVKGGKITAFVTHPDVVLAVAKLKKLTTGSNEPLVTGGDIVGSDGLATNYRIAGVPLVSSPHASPLAIWGIPRQYTFAVVRSDAELAVDSSAFFSSDRVAVRAKMRAGFAFPHPQTIIKLAIGDGS